MTGEQALDPATGSTPANASRYAIWCASAEPSEPPTPNAAPAATPSSESSRPPSRSRERFPPEHEEIPELRS